MEYLILLSYFFPPSLTDKNTVYSTRNLLCFWTFYLSLSPFFRPLFIISYFPFRKSVLNLFHCTLNSFCNEFCAHVIVCVILRGKMYIFFRPLKLLFFHLSPFVQEKKINSVFPLPILFVHTHTNIKIQCEAPCGFPESFYVLHTYRTYFTVFEKFECIFFFLFVLVSADRKVINHTGDSDLLVNPFMQTK